MRWVAVDSENWFCSPRGVIVPYPADYRCEVRYSAPTAGRAAEGLVKALAPGSAATWKVESELAPGWWDVEGLRSEFSPTVYQELCTQLTNTVI